MTTFSQSTSESLRLSFTKNVFNNQASLLAVMGTGLINYCLLVVIFQLFWICACFYVALTYNTFLHTKSINTSEHNVQCNCFFYLFFFNNSWAAAGVCPSCLGCRQCTHLLRTSVLSKGTTKESLPIVCQ